MLKCSFDVQRSMFGVFPRFWLLNSGSWLLPVLTIQRFNNLTIQRPHLAHPMLKIITGRWQPDF